MQTTKTNKLCTPQHEVPDGYIHLSGDLEHDSIVNGPGLRAVLWVQGCRQHCPGCQNPETWTEDEDAGAIVKIDKVKEELGWNVWSFTGLIFEQLPQEGPVHDFICELDALIDGPFILPKRDLSLKFRGSSNQRILHLKNGEIQSIE